MRGALLLLTASSAACSGSLEDAFIQGRAEDPCVQTIPACPGLFAGCVLNETRYARTTFPGAFRFLTPADAGMDIEVSLFFVEERDAGLSTQIFWNEPGCTDVYRFDSAGRNLFLESEDTSFVAERQALLESGEHLIEIYSDMQADVIVAVQTIVPGTE